MPIQLACPGCRRPLLVEDRFHGRAVKCPYCGCVATAPPIVAASIVPTIEASPFASRPARRSRPWLWVAGICVGAMCLPLCCCAGITYFPEFAVKRQIAEERRQHQAAVEAGVLSRDEMPRPQRRGVAAKGTTVYLAVPRESLVWICADQKAMDEFHAASRAGNKAALNQLVETERLLGGLKNMSAVVLEPGVLTYRVRVLDGILRGREGLIASEFVHDRQVP